MRPEGNLPGALHLRGCGMARLTQLRGPLKPLAPRIGWLNDDKATASRARDRATPHRSWYKTQAWRRLRWQILTRDLFACQMCGRIETDTSKLVADHKRPHRGDEALFWDAANLWCLCESCHNGAKQREERADRAGNGGGV